MNFWKYLDLEKVKVVEHLVIGLDLKLAMLHILAILLRYSLYCILGANVHVVQRKEANNDDWQRCYNVQEENLKQQISTSFQVVDKLSQKKHN
jgi:hypothetical protein